MLEDEVPNILEGRDEEGGEEPGSKVSTKVAVAWREDIHSQFHGGRWQHLF